MININNLKNNYTKIERDRDRRHESTKYKVYPKSALWRFNKLLTRVTNIIQKIVSKTTNTNMPWWRLGHEKTLELYHRCLVATSFNLQIYKFSHYYRNWNCSLSKCWNLKGYSCSCFIRKAWKPGTLIRWYSLAVKNISINYRAWSSFCERQTWGNKDFKGIMAWWASCFFIGIA